MADDKITINIIGGNMESKSFHILKNQKLEVAKRHIIARIKYKNNYINPEWSECYLLTLDYEKLDNDETVENLIKENKIKDGDNIQLKIVIIHPDTGETLCFNGLAQETLQFQKVNPNKKDSLEKKYKIDGNDAVQSVPIKNPFVNAFSNPLFNVVNNITKNMHVAYFGKDNRFFQAENKEDKEESLEHEWSWE